MDGFPRLPSPREKMEHEHDCGAAVFAGGCFWCVEAVFQRIAGVRRVEPGYCGGDEATADYATVSSGITDHAEAVKVSYDPRQVRYDQLLHVFFATHDPTQKDRQGPDSGRQYRSAVFYADEHQQRVARAYIQQIESSGVFAESIATTLEPLKAFYAAEEYHHEFVRRNPQHPYVQHWAAPKLARLEKDFEGNPGNG